MKYRFYILLLLPFACSNNSHQNNNSTVSSPNDTAAIQKEQNIKNGGVPKGNRNFNNTVTASEKDYLTGKVIFSKDSGFVKLNPVHCNGRTIYVRIEVAEAFEKMSKAALKNGIVLVVLSGARSFEQQKNIWERKWNNLKNISPKERSVKILTFSSMPMSSRHHWGTDIDMNSLENSYFESGKGLKIYEWLTKNAPDYGFCQVYTDKKNNERTGYEMEKWHWSYIPIARHNLERYNKLVETSDFKGFSGWETASEVKIIEVYVNGIDSCD